MLQEEYLILTFCVTEENFEGLDNSGLHATVGEAQFARDFSCVLRSPRKQSSNLTGKDCKELARKKILRVKKKGAIA